MDLQVFGRVFWRFRVLVLAGVVLALLLAFFAMFRVDTKGGGIQFRQQQRWTSNSMIWITQGGFPLGRAIYDQYLKTGSSPNSPIVPESGDPTRFTGLAALYVTLATSDPVEAIMKRSGPIDGSVGATQPTVANNVNAPLPFVEISGTATGPAAAEKLTTRATNALMKYVTDQQTASGIAPDKRVLLEVVKRPTPAVVTAKRSLTRPLVVFVATLLLVLGLTFVLENLRPRVRPVSAESELPSAAPTARRTA
jgi:hypothetical protein